MLLVGVINSMKDFDHVVVTLLPENDFKKELVVRVHCLNYRSKLNLLSSVRCLRKIITENQIDLIHCHLLPATFLARLAKPKRIPLIFSVHNRLSESAFKTSRISWFLEKISYRRTHLAIFVSKDTYEDYQESIGIKGAFHILPNYVEDKFFQQNHVVQPTTKKDTLKLVSIGSLKNQKNHSFLLKALSNYASPFTLEIYGEGPTKPALLKEISELDLTNQVRLMGTIEDPSKVLPNYDLFVFPSQYEGYGLAPVEAMAVGLPVLLSDIAVLREVTQNQAIFFNLDDEADFRSKVRELHADPNKRQKLSVESKKLANAIGRKDQYIRTLKSIYRKQIGNNK